MKPIHLLLNYRIGQPTINNRIVPVDKLMMFLRNAMKADSNGKLVLTHPNDPDRGKIIGIYKGFREHTSHRFIGTSIKCLVQPLNTKSKRVLIAPDTFITTMCHGSLTPDNQYMDDFYITGLRLVTGSKSMPDYLKGSD